MDGTSNVVAHGVDIVATAKIQDVWDRHGARFLERIYSPGEREYCLAYRYPVQRLAGRFAAKEALLKVLGLGLRGGLSWPDLEVVNDELGAPHVRLHGLAVGIAEQRGVDEILISISHTPEMALASAIGLRRG